MIELVATITITISSVLLFGYWFRYTCLLILSAKTTRDYAGEVANANQLSFLAIHNELQSAVPAELGRLHAALDRDYELLKGLFQQNAADAGLERRMLQIDYRLMGVWRRTVQTFSPTAAKRALEEMALVVAHFANSMGEQTAAAAA